MIYQIYQAHADMMQPVRYFAGLGRDWLGTLPLAARDLEPLRHLGAAWDLIAETGLTHVRPDFGIEHIEIDGQPCEVREERVLVTPFGTLLHFRKDSTVEQPRVLIVSPMACHFATLLRETIRTLLPEHDVYVTDWHNVRDVPLSEGSFDLDDYVEHLMRFLTHLGPRAHLIGICQPCPAALAAVALMSEDKHPATPRTLTLMAGPVDTRLNPTAVNQRALGHTLDWFERVVIDRVPSRYAGAGRKVYPGFLQIAGFMTMNLSRHQESFQKLYFARVDNDDAKAEPIKEFYDEYLAVCDLPAEFYLQTVHRIFQDHHLAKGCFTWRGRPVNPAAITRTALFTVEGGRDDICGLGQTRAALDLCTGLPAKLKSDHLEADAGHYGVFSGRRWVENVFPRVRELIRQHA